MDFSGKQVVITGGTGALGMAVVGMLLKAGAACTIPYQHEAEALSPPRRRRRDADPGVRSRRRGDGGQGL
jgi:NAD(P)-dependent dehydrogenase (short-subunit alcohol dehydrogenase family)